MHPGDAAAAHTGAAAKGETGMRARTGTIVLVVEDDLDLLSTICDALLAAGIEPAPASSAEEAIASLELGLRPDLVLLDLFLPGMSGDALMERLKGERRWHDIPIVVMTAYLPALGGRALSDGYLPMPFTLEALEDVVTVLCGPCRRLGDARSGPATLLS